MSDKYENLELESHTIRAFHCKVLAERHSFVIECVTKGNRRLMFEFPSEGPTQLLDALTKAFEEHPEMREWTSPTTH